MRTTVSLHPTVQSALEELIRRGGFEGLSDYIAANVRRQAGLDSFITTAPAAPAPHTLAA